MLFILCYFFFIKYSNYMYIGSFLSFFQLLSLSFFLVLPWFHFHFLVLFLSSMPIFKFLFEYILLWVPYNLVFISVMISIFFFHFFSEFNHFFTLFLNICCSNIVSVVEFHIQGICFKSPDAWVLCYSFLLFGNCLVWVSFIY